MRISVVVIAYNLQSFVGDAIRSVLTQTRQADEIIVVDDCSTDDTAAVIRSFGDSVKFLAMPENSGALVTALRGVKEATGDIICMLDGDDYWSANKIEVVEREFSANPSLMLLSHDHVRVDATGRELGVRDETHFNIEALRRQASSQHDLSRSFKQTILEQRGYWLGSAYSFRRRCFDSELFQGQLATFGSDKLHDTYLDLVVAPFLVLTNPDGDVGYAPDAMLYYRIHDRGSLAGNRTPEKAIRSAKKGRTINELIYSIFLQNKADQSLMQRRVRILREYDYLVALYSAEWFKAIRLYFDLLLGFWNVRQAIKESKRLLAVSLLGVRRFLVLKEGRG
jgi:glycosyltransferase involved in cell wall biosynthesis